MKASRLHSFVVASLLVLTALPLVLVASASCSAQEVKGVVRVQVRPEAAAEMEHIFASTRPAGDPQFSRTSPYSSRVEDRGSLREIGIPDWISGARLVPWMPMHSVALPDLRRRSNPELSAQSASVAGSSSLQQLRTAEDRLSRWFVLHFDTSLSVDRVVMVLKRSATFIAVETVNERRPCYSPNDSLVPQQYSLPLMHAFEAWDVVRADSSMLVADVDLGTDWSHPDLQKAVFVNTGEIGLDSEGMDKRANGVDDDGNGLIDDWHGWDFDGRDGASPDNDTRTLESHGTHTAGILAATGDNRIGIAGIAFGAKLLPVKASNEAGVSIDFGFDGIVYAADMHAKVVSCSWGGPTRSQAEQDVVDYATAKDCAVVAAAGNNGIRQYFYPASYDHVLSVGAIQDGGFVAGYSNFNTNVDVVAPGTDVLSTMPGGWYYTLTGTSMACPNAAGALALVRKQYPAYSIAEAIERLRVTSSILDTSASATFPVDPARFDLLGHGVINIYQALTAQNIHSARIDGWSMEDANSNQHLEPGETAGVRLSVKNYLADLKQLHAHVEVVEGQDAVTVLTPDIDFGAIAGGAVVANDPQHFVLQAADSIDHNAVVLIKVIFSDSSVGYDRDVDYFQFVLNPDYLDLNANNLTVTFSSKGTIGYNDVIENNQGSGFQWRIPPASITPKGRNVLYQAGLILATDQEHVVDGVEGYSDSFPDEDFVPIERVHYVEPNKPKALQQLSSRFDDSGEDSTRRVGVIVDQDAYAFEGLHAANAAVVRYIIRKAPGFNDTSFLNAGLFADWDIGLSGSINSTYFDTITGIAVTHRLEAGYPWVGVKIISPLPAGAGLNYRAIRNDGTEGEINTYDGFSDIEKWQALTAWMPSAGPSDVSNLLGVTGFVLSPESPDTLTAIMALGESEEDLRAAVAQTEAIWNGQARVGSTLANTAAVLWPNPFAQALSVALPVGIEHADCVISDMLGNAVYRGELRGQENLIDVHFAPGSYIIHLNSGTWHYTAPIIRVEE